MRLDIPPLNRHHWTILGLVALAAFCAAYDLALLQLALPQIADSLTIPLAQLSYIGALIKLGSLPAFAFALAADRWGRRHLLIGAVVGFTLATGATALAFNVATFVTLQFLARLFVTVMAILAGVFITEEFPAHARGWGMGAFTGLSTVGGGVAALLFATVDRWPFGWRGLYVVGLFALLLLPLLISHLPETTRFQSQRLAQPTAHLDVRWQPLLQLLRMYPSRLLVLSGIVLLFNLGGDAAFFYDPTYLQEAHGWQPWQVSMLNLSAGFMAIVGSMVAGRMSDGMGRKRTVKFFFIALPLLIIGYYNASGWLLPVLWAALLFSSVGTTVILSATSNELFPTSYRATAAGATAVLATVSGSLSLTLHGQMVRMPMSPWSAISWLALMLLLAPLLIDRLPETSGRSLEEITPEQAG